MAADRLISLSDDLSLSCAEFPERLQFVDIPLKPFIFEAQAALAKDCRPPDSVFFGIGTRHFVPGSHLPSLRDNQTATATTADRNVRATQDQ
jgi:hypothetical protein